MNSVMRKLGRIAAVGAVALVLAGAATPAAARDRSEMPAVVKGMARGCYQMGGTTIVHMEQISSSVRCLLPNGTQITCLSDDRSPYPDVYCESRRS
jgi:hypothetical protein